MRLKVDHESQRDLRRAMPREIWWFDGRDLLVKRDGVWRPMCSAEDTGWHAFTPKDLADIAAAMSKSVSAAPELSG